MEADLEALISELEEEKIDIERQIRAFLEKLGVKFEVTQPATWQETLEKVKDRDVDMLAALAPTPERERHLLFSRHYLQLPGAIIARKTTEGAASLKDLRGKKVAIVSGYVWHALIPEDEPRIQIVPVTDLVGHVPGVFCFDGFAVGFSHQPGQAEDGDHQG